MEFLRSLLRRRFARAQVATSRDVGYFLRLESSELEEICNLPGLAKSSLEQQTEFFVFLRNKEVFQGKNYTAFLYLQRVTAMQKKSEFNFSSFAAQCLIFVRVCS